MKELNRRIKTMKKNDEEERAEKHKMRNKMVKMMKKQIKTKKKKGNGDPEIMKLKRLSGCGGFLIKEPKN